jgi:hypothetical protein
LEGEQIRKIPHLMMWRRDIAWPLKRYGFKDK